MTKPQMFTCAGPCGRELRKRDMAALYSPGADEAETTWCMDCVDAENVKQQTRIIGETSFGGQRVALFDRLPDYAVNPGQCAYCGDYNGKHANDCTRPA